ncbi:MAG: hypothetical protein M3R46_14975 [Actinomycetota bacterium]|nr:hypothetical protein [Actinomycetota bacterium]
MATKQRLSASVNKVYIEEGRAAVEAGRAESLSAWVNEALRKQAEDEGRLRALDELMTEYQAEHGEFTEEELEENRRDMEARAIKVRRAR